MPLIANERGQRIELGGKLSVDAPVSMIFFGPPGTAKTDLAKRIARVLGWPLLTIDASQFLKKGMDGVYAEADTIFGMLAVAERTLVLLDEFDEMVRARETAPDVLSRFLTTAMLPKLHKIHDNRRLVFVVATNHIDWFDVAIRRPGRFDVILQVMQPTAAAKLGKEEWKELLKIPEVSADKSESRKKLAALTYLETDILVSRLKPAETDEKRLELLEDAYTKCTMRSEVPSGDTALGDVSAPTAEKATKVAAEPAVTRWEDLCVKQSEQIRV
jgi:SpoVK/Ycf46/Vps4 family AAA+-type ATPase